MSIQRNILQLIGNTLSAAADLMEELIKMSERLHLDNEILRKENQQMKERLDGIERCKAR